MSSLRKLLLPLLFLPGVWGQQKPDLSVIERIKTEAYESL